MNFFKSIFKRNQIIVFTIGLMIITAGYLSYMNNNKEGNASLTASDIADSEEMASIGDAKLVSANVAEDTNSMNSNSLTEEADNTNIIDTNTIDSNSIDNTLENNTGSNNDNATTTVTTSSSNINSTQDIDSYFTSSRLERESMYSQRIENYQDILNNSNVSEAQKKTAQAEITKLNNEQNAIMIAENLIKTKGIEDLIIFVNGESINVIVKGDEVKKEEIAQMQNIITRELEADIGNIHIMNKD